MIDDDEDAVHRVNISDCKSSTVSLHSYSGPFWRTFTEYRCPKPLHGLDPLGHVGKTWPAGLNRRRYSMCRHVLAHCDILFEVEHEIMLP